MEPPKAKAGMTGDEAATLVEAIASEEGAWELGARAVATAVRLSKEEVPVRIMFPFLSVTTP